MSAPLATGLASLAANKRSQRVRPSAEEIDKASTMPSREPASRPARRKVKTESQIGIRGDSEIIQRFVDYKSASGLSYVDALEALMDQAEVPK